MGGKTGGNGNTKRGRDRVEKGKTDKRTIKKERGGEGGGDNTGLAQKKGPGT